MAISAKVISGRGGFNRKGNLANYSVQEASSPTVPGDTSGGVGSLSFDVAATSDSYLLSGNEVELFDSERGTMRALVSSFTNDSGLLSVDTDNRLALLTVTRTLRPFNGTLTDLFRYCFALCGVATGYAIDQSYDVIDVAIPAFTGDVWTFLKELCIPYGAEITLVAGNIWVRPVRTTIATNMRDSAAAVTTSVQGLAATVEVNYYNSAWINNGVIYQAGDTESALQVEANQFATVTVDANTSLTAISQPLPVLVDAWASRADSAYVVYGANGPILPGTWNTQGGKVWAEIDPEDNTKVNITVRGPNGKEAPYTIGIPMGIGEDNIQYASSIRLTGTGVKFEKRVFSQPTGVDPRFVQEDRATTVDSYAYATLEQAQDAACRLAGKSAGPQQTVKVSTGGVLHRGDKHTGRQLTMDEFNAEYAGKTFDQFNTLWTGKTFDQFNANYGARFSTDLLTQAFGNIGGARVALDDNFYRIREATITPGEIQYSAECDTLMEDFNASWSGATMDDFNAVFAGATMDEFNVAPLRRG